MQVSVKNTTNRKTRVITIIIKFMSIAPTKYKNTITSSVPPTITHTSETSSMNTKCHIIKSNNNDIIHARDSVP